MCSGKIFSYQRPLPLPEGTRYRVFGASFPRRRALTAVPGARRRPRRPAFTGECSRSKMHVNIERHLCALMNPIKGGTSARLCSKRRLLAARRQLKAFRVFPRNMHLCSERTVSGDAISKTTSRGCTKNVVSILKSKSELRNLKIWWRFRWVPTTTLKGMEIGNVVVCIRE
ncbi:hypothetical protein EVAR_49373_1 [Eumeta japonica]|uniref:Uncharacterized protein n=1 Tax=Eumeta variegata TaxID=151549 RepID=A0A4C1XV93_EUMVA|nr:hypothetical protein EVAR_49373_1 [Eumeta japonica]